ncbi:MAG: hypothetical protein R3Y06_11110, partial [Faecalibacterium sp.]
SSFLQIPPRDGHPCFRLTLPTTERVVDFHHQVIAHAGRTIKTALRQICAQCRFLINLICAVNTTRLFLLKQV